MKTEPKFNIGDVVYYMNKHFNKSKFIIKMEIKAIRFTEQGWAYSSGTGMHVPESRVAKSPQEALNLYKKMLDNRYMEFMEAS